MKIEKIRQYAQGVIKTVEYYKLRAINVHELLGVEARYDSYILRIQELTKLAKFSQSVIDEIDSGFASNSLTEEELKKIRTDGIDYNIGRKIIIIDKDSEKAGVQYGRDLEPDQTMTDFIMIAEKYDFRCIVRRAKDGIECANDIRDTYERILHYKPIDPSLALHKAYFFIIGALYKDLRHLRKASYFIRMEPGIKSIRKALDKDADIVKRMLKTFYVKSIDLRAIYKLDHIIEAIERAIKGEDIEETLSEKYLHHYDINLELVSAFYALLLKYYNEELGSGSAFDFIDKTRALLNMKIVDEFDKAAPTSSKFAVDQSRTGVILSTVAKACMIQHFTHEKCNEVDDIYTLLPLKHTDGIFTDKRLIKDFRAFRFFIEPKRINEVQELYMKHRKEK